MGRSWKDVMLSEIQAKREAEARRRERRQALRDKAVDRYKTIVRPVIAELAENAPSVEMEESVDVSTALVWARLTREAGWVEIEFDPYQPLVFLRRRLAGQQATDLETLDYDAITAAQVSDWCKTLLG